MFWSVEDKYFSSTLRTHLNREAIPCKVQAISIGQDSAGPSNIEWEVAAAQPTPKMGLAITPNSAGPSNIEWEVAAAQPTPKMRLAITPNSPGPSNMEWEVAAAQPTPRAPETTGRLILTPKRRKIRSLRVQLHRLRGRVLKTTQKEPKIHTALACIKSKVPGPLYELVRNCISSDAQCVQRNRWSPEMKTKALNIYLQSPSSYRMIRKLLNFPSKPTLLRVLQKYTTDVGFSDKLFDILKNACSKMTETDKLCCLMWDEMSLKANLCYNSNEDIVDGFERYSDNYSSDRIANQGLVFMVRGICSNYKQVLGYFLAQSSTPGNTLVELIVKAIEKLSSIGLKVVATVCDQGSNNQKAYHLLGVTTDQPCFTVNDRKIVAFFDTPHLIKSTRNMFRKYSAKFYDNYTAKWEHIVQLYNSDKDNEFRATKLTDRDVYVSGFRVMRVRTAARVLSHSVAAAILTMSSFGMLEGGVHTGKFVGYVDKAFDSLNGRVITDNAKPLYGAVKEGTTHHEVWKEMASFFQSVQFINTEGKRVHAPSTYDWVQNFHAAKLLWEVAKKEGMHSLMMGRINQDCLENTFCIIRRKGGNRDNPSCNDFHYTFRAVAAQNMLICSDYDVVLASIESTGTSCEMVVNPPNSEMNQFIARSCNFSDLSNDLVNRNAMFYVAGYLAKKLCSAKQCCNYCCTAVLDSEKVLPAGITFPIFKEYEKVTNGLQYPSANLLKCVEDMTHKFDNNFKNLISMSDVVQRFTSLIQDEVCFDFLAPNCNSDCFIVHKC